MKTYTKLPVSVPAKQFNGDLQEILDWLVEIKADPYYFSLIEEQDRAEDPELVAEVYDKLHSTWVGVKLHDWILRGVEGELYPHDGELFKKVYEETTEPVGLRETIANSLGDVVIPTRDWSAWGYGTMTEEDFVLAGEDDEFVDSVVQEVLKVNTHKLSQHQWDKDFNSCTCGKRIPTIVDSDHCVYVPDDDRMALHQAEQLGL